MSKYLMIITLPKAGNVLTDNIFKDKGVNVLKLLMGHFVKEEDSP